MQYVVHDLQDIRQDLDEEEDEDDEEEEPEVLKKTFGPKAVFKEGILGNFEPTNYGGKTGAGAHHSHSWRWFLGVQCCHS